MALALTVSPDLAIRDANAGLKKEVGVLRLGGGVGVLGAGVTR